MIRRRSPQTLEVALPGQHVVHSHGSKEGLLERRVVWPLATTDEVREVMARTALTEMLASRDMNGHTPEAQSSPGSVIADLGRVTYEAAEEIAHSGLVVLLGAEDRLREQIATREIEASIGVGLSVAVVSFPDQQG